MSEIIDPRAMPIRRFGVDAERPRKVRVVRKHEEDDLQTQIVARFNERRGNDVICFSVPNGARVGWKEAKKLKRTGLCAGIADLVFLNPLGIAFFIEVKTAKGKLSAEQREFEAYCRDHNISHAVVRSLTEAEAWMERFGLIRRRP